MDAYRAVLWFGDLPHDACVQRREDAEDDVWLAVNRVERDAPPAPPDELKSWLTEKALRDSFQTLPALSPRTVGVIDIVGPDGDHEAATEEILLEDHPEVEVALRRWAPAWQEWGG